MIGIGDKTGGLLSYFTRHRTAANLLLVLLLFSGLTALPQMRAQFFPDVVVEDVSVSVSWDGAGANDVDNAIVQLLEPVLVAVEGVTESASTSREGRASMSLEFEPGWDMNKAAEDIKAAIETVSNLPEGADEPTVRWGGWRDSVTNVSLTGPVGLDQIARFADELVVRLFAEGVTETSISGVSATQILVEVSTADLLRHDITMAEIASVISASVDTNPAGNVGASGARVRAGSQTRSSPDIADLVLRTEADGSALTIGDVAVLTAEGVDRLGAFYVGENPAAIVRVPRSAQGDAIEIQQLVEEVTEEMALTLPEGVTVDLYQTRAEAIKARLGLLMENGALGLALVLTLLFLFLNARTAFWVAAGIPVAMLSAIAMMYLVGLTINMISLFALIITLGIVVDDAIVVGEHADFRARRLGESPVEAAENAARRMFPPVFSSTVTTVIAFFGLTAISGRFGDLILAIPLTVIVVLVASLIECFLILPNHLSHSLAAKKKEAWYDWPSRQVNRGFAVVRDRAFRPFVAFVIGARFPLIGVMCLLLSMQVAQLISGNVSWRFFSPPERSTVSGNFAMAPAATRADSAEMMVELQRAVEQTGLEYEQEYGANPVVYAIAQIGGTAGRGLASTESKDADQLGGITIELIDADLRSYSASEFVRGLQQNVVNHPLAETVSFRGGRFGPGGDSIEIQLFGAASETLKAAAEDLKTKLAQYPEVSGLEDSLAYDKEELILDLTAQGKALGFTIDTLSRTLSNRLGGIEAATYPEGVRTASIRVELQADELTADFLERMQMRTATGDYVPLADIVSVQRRTGFSTVRRENGIRVVTVSGDLSEDDAARATEIQEIIETELLPTLSEDFGITYNLAGLSEQENRFLSDAMFGLMAVLIGIYLTLSWIFSSWTRPLIVMAVIPFGLIGAIYGHAIWGVSMSMFSVVGLIGMTGIIINDSIVLVTTIDSYAKDRGIRKAIIDGTCDRLRPVMLTTLTTVLGLAPLLYEGSADAQFLKPTVITLAYGLGFGMVIVLLLIPALIAVQTDVSQLTTSTRRVWKNPKRFGVAGRFIWAVTGLHLLWAGVVFLPFLFGTALLPFLDGVVISRLVLAHVLGAAAITVVAWGTTFWSAGQRA